MADPTDFPTMTCGNGLHYQRASREPVFHFTQLGGAHGIAGLATVKRWARDVLEGAVSFEEIVRESYVLMPGDVALLRCALAVEERGGVATLVVQGGTVGMSGELYTCAL